MYTSQIFSLLATCCLLVGLTQAKPAADIGDYPTQDSYAVIPNLPQDSPTETELNLELVPPGMFEVGGPHMYYMNSDGMAVSADEQQKRLIKRKREAIPADIDTNEQLLADETVIIGPPSGNRPFGTPAVNLGFRPARAYYARRYHKYPWNYH